jgi:hypothetical protein
MQGEENGRHNLMAEGYLHYNRKIGHPRIRNASDADPKTRSVSGAFYWGIGAEVFRGNSKEF